MSESRQRLYRTVGIVIRHNDVGEKDRILTLYTPERGKVRLLIRGVRRPGSRLAGHVEMLTYGSFIVARGHNLDVVTQAQALDSFSVLREDLQRIAWAYYLAELAERMTPEQAENVPAFQLLLEALQHLDRGDNAEMIVRSFEVHLLGYMGYRPQLWRCVSCDAQPDAQTQLFSPLLGGLLCARCRERDHQARPLSPEVLRVLRYLQRNGLSDAERLHLPEEVGREVEQVLRLYTRNILECDLKAAGFLQDLRNRLPRPTGAMAPQEEER